MTKYFTDNEGKYVGAFDGAEAPADAIEVSHAPEDARFKWDGNAWIVPDEIKDDVKIEKAFVLAFNNGATDQAKLNALWNLALGDSTQFDKIQAIIAQAKKDVGI